MGNLFSVRRALERSGVEAFATASAEELLDADGIVLPGVGAFGDAMQALRGAGLDSALRRAAGSGKPLFGICLGMQLLMEESPEFGRHAGLGLLQGRVLRLEPSAPDAPSSLKVPQVGWNRIWSPGGPAGGATTRTSPWAGTPLGGLREGASMYFVHSFYVEPRSPELVLSETEYGRMRFCSSLARGNVFACQFHPERSGPEGLQVYRYWASSLEAAWSS